MEESQCFTLGYGGKPKPNEKTPSDSLQVKTSKYFTLSSLEKRMTQRGGQEGLTEWQALCSTKRKTRDAEEVGASGRSCRRAGPAPRGNKCLLPVRPEFGDTGLL